MRFISRLKVTVVLPIVCLRLITRTLTPWLRSVNCISDGFPFPIVISFQCPLSTPAHIPVLILSDCRCPRVWPALSSLHGKGSSPLSSQANGYFVQIFSAAIASPCPLFSTMFPEVRHQNVSFDTDRSDLFLLRFPDSDET